MILGTGVPDDCRLDTGFRTVQLRDVLFQELQTTALHADSLKPVTVRVRILPAHSLGVVLALHLRWEAMNGDIRRRRIYALPDTVFRTERGAVPAAELVEGDKLLPDLAGVTTIQRLYVQADFCRPVSMSPVYVDMGGIYVLACKDRK